MKPDERVTTADLRAGDVIRRDKKGRKRSVITVEPERKLPRLGSVRVNMFGGDGRTFVICEPTTRWYREVQ